MTGRQASWVPSEAQVLLIRWLGCSAAACAALYLLRDVKVVGPGAPLPPAPELDALTALALMLAGVAAGLFHKPWLVLRASALVAGAAALSHLSLGSVAFLSAVPPAAAEITPPPGAVAALVSALTCVSVALLGLAQRRSTLSTLMGLVAASALFMACVSAVVFHGISYLTFSAFPDSRTFVSWPTVAIFSLLSLALLARTRTDALGRAERYGREDLAVFERQLTVLLTASTFAGVLGAAVVSVNAGEVALDELKVAADRHSGILHRQVLRTVEAVSATLLTDESVRAALTDARSTPDPRLPEVLVARLQSLDWVGDIGFRLTMGSDVYRWGAWQPDGPLPVLALKDARGGFLPDGSVQVDLGGQGGAPSLAVHVKLRHTAAAPGASARLSTLEAYVCRPAGALMHCTAPACVPARGGRTHTATLALDDLHGARKLAMLSDCPALAHTPALTATAPLGRSGGLVLLQASAVRTYRVMGWPLVLALGAWCIVAMLAAGWAYCRQLPTLRGMRQARAELAAIIRHVPQALLVTDEAGRILSCNPAATRLSGLTEGDLQKCNVDEVVTGWQKAWQEGADPADGLASIQAAPGEDIPIQWHRSHFHVDGQVRMLITLEDLRATRRTAILAQQWFQVFHLARQPLAVIRAGQPTVIEQVNGAFAALARRPPEACSGLAVTALFPEDAFRVGTTRDMLLLAPEGHATPVQASVDSLPNGDDGSPLMLLSLEDISTLKAAQEHAAITQARLHAVLDALPIGIWLGDTEGKVERVNSEVEQIWGAAVSCEQRGSTPNRPWWLDRSVTLNHRDVLLRRAATTRAPVPPGQLDITNLRGECRTTVSWATPLADDRGRILGTMAIDQDVTDLRRSEAAVRQAQVMADNLLESSSVGMAVWEADGRIRRANTSWAKLLGPSLTNCDALNTLNAPDDGFRLGDLAMAVLSGTHGPHVGEHRLRRPDGALAWTMVVISRLPVQLALPAQLLIQAFDVDERRRHLDALTASEQRLAAAQRLAHLGDWVWQVAAGQVDCSPQLLDLLGLDNEQTLLPAECLHKYLHPEDKARARAAAQEAIRKGSRYELDTRWLTPNGQTLHLRVLAVVRQTPDGPVVMGTTQDITARKLIENELVASRQKLRELVAHEDQLIEEERKRIAREVHDELGQLLTALRMDLSMLRKALASEEPIRNRIDGMRRTVDQTIEVVRHVASNLRPAALDLGLIPAIEWLAEDFAHRWEVRCQFHAPRDEDIALPEAVSLALFRVVQESLTNIARHAEATSVTIVLHRVGQALHLTVTDDGHGFDVDHVPSRGLGLLGMRERMRAIDAHLDIASSAKGTRVSIAWPHPSAPSPN